MSSVPPRIHHINFVVPDLDLAVRQFSRVLDTTPCEPESIEQRAVRLVRFELDGVWLVLVAPTAGDSPAALWLDENGPGLFLISFETGDLHVRLDALAMHGIKARGKPRRGLDDWLVSDLDLATVFGIPLQLTERLSENSRGDK